MTTTQERTTWAQDWRTARAARVNRPLQFSDCVPYLLTPRMMRGPQRRTTIFFGGFGFALFMYFVYAMLVLMAVSLALCWDMCVVTVFAIAMMVEPIRNAIKRRHRTRATA